MFAEFDALLIVILEMDTDDMDELEELQLYSMYMCYIFIVNAMIIACVIRHCSLRNNRVEHEIELASIRWRKQFDYLHHVVYENDVNCIDKLCMDRRSFHRLCHLLTTTGRLRGTRNVMVEEMLVMF